MFTLIQTNTYIDEAMLINSFNQLLENGFSSCTNDELFITFDKFYVENAVLRFFR